MTSRSARLLAPLVLAAVACTDPGTGDADGTTGSTGSTGGSTGDSGLVEGPDPDALSTLGLLSWDGQAFTYAEGVQPYTLATPLFSDYAVKERAIALPEGTSATYTGPGVLDFPVGTVIVKSFLFPADLRAPTEDLQLIETRVLTREEDGWDNQPYRWNEDETEAFRAPSGAVVPISATGLDGGPLEFSYLVPQRNQCVDCHERSDAGERSTTPIGPTARNLHVGDQLGRLVEAGVITGLPALAEIDAAFDAQTLEGVDPASLDDATLTHAARDYLDVNCAHCHNPAGTEGISSQLFLEWSNDDAFHYGVCKKPGSAGRGNGGLTYDIVPGEPEQSILWYRMQTDVIGEMMPDLGRSMVHEHGVELVAEWIRRLPGTCEEEA